MCQMSEACIREDYLRDLYYEEKEKREKPLREEVERLKQIADRQSYLELLENAKKTINW